MYQKKVSDLNKLYILCNVQIICMMHCFSYSSLILAQYKLEVKLSRYKPK
jgi:hypothetical protein